MTLHNWLEDIPQQFQGKKNIEVLLNAFAKQIDELYQVYEDLKTKTTLDNATGQSLKYAGDILSMTTKEAQSILKLAGTGVITDETYRKVLQYQALKNNCDCTYEDIMDSIKILWDTESIKYVEDPEHPATIYIALPEVDIDGIDPAIGRVLAIKPGGVAMIYSVDYLTRVNISGIEKVSLPKVIVTTPVDNSNVATVPKLQITSKVVNEENVTVSLVTASNLWFLDGSYMLDGTKTLNADKTEEVL